MKTGDETNIISLAKVIREEEHVENKKLAQKKKLDEKKKKLEETEEDQNEQMTLDLE